MRVRLAREAEQDLARIGDFIGRDSPLRAESYANELLDRCEALAEHSSRNPVQLTHRGREQRRCPYQRYLIFYAVVAGEIEIVRILHSARDYMELLFPD